MRKKKREISEQSGSFFDFPTAHPEERSDEGSHEILQPFGLQDDPLGVNKKKKSPRGQISKLIEECHRIAKKKGWWDSERNDGELIALMHSELSEALEAMRNHGTKDNIAEELADCCIRIFDYCGAKGINLEKTLLKKIEYNKSRPYRHGKKF